MGIERKITMMQTSQQVNKTIENNLPEFEAKVWGTEELKSFFALTHIFVEELTIHVVKEEFGEGLVFRTMDPSHVGMLDILWNSSNFEKWTVNKEGSFAIRTKQAYDLVKCFDKKENVTMSIKDNSLVFETKTTKQVINLIEPDQKSIFDTPLPKITYNVTMATTRKMIKDIVKKVGMVAEHITMNMHGQIIEFSGKGDKGEANLKLEKGMPDVPEFNIREDSICNYNLEYIKEFLKCLSGSMVTLEFSTRMPLRMRAKFGNDSRIDMYLAPRVEM